MTDTVVSGRISQQPKTVSDSDGAQITRSGQRTTDSLGTAVKAAYANMTYSPLITMLYVAALASLVADIFDNDGPLVFLRNETKRTIDAKKKSALALTLCKLIYSLLVNIVDFEAVIYSALLLWIPYFLKPSGKNAALTAAATVIMVVFSNVGPLELFLFTQLWYLYVMLRNPRYKFLIAFVLGATFVVGYATTTEKTRNAPAFSASGSKTNTTKT